jgi:FKBP-type peptidyl-prolyl cis-trans isomerase
MTIEDARTYIQAYFQKIAESEGTNNRAEGEAFLATNKEKDGIVVTESGLQYEILEVGDGPKPTADQQVKVHYTGTLLDGTVFDSSVERGEPATFGVGQVIPGWTEALQLMPEGSKWKVYIPGDLAYGERGAGADIGPNAALIFEVELLEVIE